MVTVAVSCIVLEIKRYWSKIAIFSYPVTFDASVMGIFVGILKYCLVSKY